MKIRNDKLEHQIKVTLGLQPNEKVTEDGLLSIIGIHVGYDLRNTVYIPWNSDGQAFQMHVPNLFLTPDMLNDEDMKLFSHIVSFHSIVSALPIRFLAALQNLTELYLYSAVVENWSFLLGLSGLHKVLVRNCGNKGNEILGILANIRKNQKMNIKPYKPVLDDMILTYLSITDISPLQGIPSWTQLDLSHNGITDLCPLAESRPYYLRLRYNKLADISSLENSGLSHIIFLFFQHKIRFRRQIVGSKNYGVKTISVFKIYFFF